MKYYYKYSGSLFCLAACCFMLLISCSEDWRGLPKVSPSDYEGKIEGFDSSGQVQPDHLIAYWSFNGTEAEIKTGTKPTAGVNASLVDGGVTGQALKLDSGYLYYGKQFPMFDSSFKSFTISEWVQVQNNGSYNTMSFMLARPGESLGYINFMLETSHYPASDTSALIIHPRYVDANGGTQDNVNAWWTGDDFHAPANPPGKWIHLVLTYSFSYEGSNAFHIWANGKDIGNYNSRGSYFACKKPNEVIIGAWYSNIPGKSVAQNAMNKPMTGKIDEIRIYDMALGTADILALYKLGKAGQ